MVWLNEAQHYLGNPGLGEQVAAAIHSLLTEPARGPILVLGTLWPEFADEYTDLPSPGKEDRYSRVRELLAGRTLTVPDSFDEQALQTAASLAKDGDQLLADALTRATAGGRVAQDLAGAPELLRRYERSTPAAKALLEAAMDGRRLGIGLHLPQVFLIDAASDYLSDDDFDQLTEDWAESSFADLARPVHGKQAPLRRTGARPDRRPPGAPLDPALGPVFRLADYLEQHGRKARRAKCPPASFWHAAFTHLARPEDLNDLAESAVDRHRLQWAYHLHHRAADLGDLSALVYMGRMQEGFGRNEEAEDLFRQAAESGDSNALLELAFMYKKFGAEQEAYSLFRLAADAGNRRAVIHLVLNLVDDGDWEGAEAVASPALDGGYPLALYLLAEQRERAGDSAGAAPLYCRAAEAGESRALVDLVRLRRQAGDRDGAEALEKQVAAAGKPHELYSLAVLREAAGEPAEARALIHQAVGAGDFAEVFPLVTMRLQAGDREGAEALVTLAADGGDARALTYLAQLRDDSGDRVGAEELARRAADGGDTLALCFLATRREEAGDFEGAETLYRQAIEVGDESVLARLARRRDEVGDRQGADAYYRQAADAGKAQHLKLGARWPHGLDADGVPTAPWL
ncbi:tetratricopeptide repeat protein [Streptomyces sp. PTD9-10]|uniref:tetratricopeptide repeat protein n=1 Tax=Streptomyces sp. PTD9-10 TaxID=3120151 RepID=UPI00300AD14C